MLNGNVRLISKSAPIVAAVTRIFAVPASRSSRTEPGLSWVNVSPPSISKLVLTLSVKAIGFEILSPICVNVRTSISACAADAVPQRSGRATSALRIPPSSQLLWKDDREFTTEHATPATLHSCRQHDDWAMARAARQHPPGGRQAPAGALVGSASV